MKINFDEVNFEEKYKVGNVIKDYDDNLFLVVKSTEEGYALVNLNKNIVTGTYETIEELANKLGDKEDVLVNAEINVL
ncbi:hypothetical protein [Ligilactobacillus salivarius]|uniref:hypothetical protein n=1 Tax=Ligilactobacillus salivarius TaxID=1624 RepID=UPI002966E8DB|nr:hypothetical protein [Ligilactobacillus salivarius]MDW3023114.1 hypothetical protein [Ligilactobacillus salivarius]